MFEALPHDTTIAPVPELIVSKTSPKGRVAVALKIGGQVRFMDTCNPQSGRSRQGLIDGAIAAFPALDDPAMLKQLEAEIIATASSASEDAGLASRPSAEMLIDHALASGIEVFCCDAEGDAEPFMSRSVGGHRETYRIGGRASRTALAQVAWKAFHSVVTEQVMTDVLATLAMKALTGEPRHPVGVRVLSQEDRQYLDLANSAWEVVEISPEGWVVKAADEVPVRFVRPAGLRELPSPEPGGDLDALRAFLNLPGEDEWLLVRAWMTAALRTGLSYALLVVTGEAGSAKSTCCTVIKSLLDPNRCNLRVKPRNSEDMFSAAMHSHVQCYENLSGLSAEFSDCFCIIATGGAVAKRKLYTDNEEAFARAQNPVLLNGIENPATRSDLADRCVVIVQPTIPDEKRMPEEQFRAKFDAALPRLLGALLDLAAGTMRELANLGPQRLPRMADFCRWGIAMERYLQLDAGTFMAAYARNRDASHLDSVTVSVVGASLLRLLDRDTRWSGTASLLMTELKALLPEEDHGGPREFPRTPSALSNQLGRLSPSLRAIGISFSQHRDPTRKRERIISLDASGWNTARSAQDASDASDGDSPDSRPGDSPPPSGRPGIGTDWGPEPDVSQPSHGGSDSLSEDRCNSPSEASEPSGGGDDPGDCENPRTIQSMSFEYEVLRRFGGPDGAIEHLDDGHEEGFEDLFRPLREAVDQASNNSNSEELRRG